LVIEIGDWQFVIIFGHRGAPGYPRRGENTMMSFRRALESGADGIEFDVRRSADHQLVVIHDETIDRTTNGRGLVREFSYEQLRRFDAGFGEPIPLLSQVLDEFGARCTLNIELKDCGLASDVRELVLPRGIAGNVIVSSFDWTELQPLIRQVPIALLSSTRSRLVGTARTMHAIAIHPRQDIVSQKLVRAAHEAGLKVYAWTVNETADAMRMRQMGVDGIFSDFPERFCRGSV
jgi:glycerophosphoryl diester phosphodiesterase